MINQFSRSELIFGVDGLDKLRNSNVLLLGVGGVGSYIAEGLIRGGVGKLTIVDNDDVALTNLNRQIIALHSTLGKSKVEVAKQRLEDINPNAEITALQMFYTGSEIDLSEYDYIADAIDSVTPKLNLIENAFKLDVPIISSMGTGNKLDPTRLEISDIYKTTGCPLAKVMRNELRKRQVGKLKVVYSTEPAVDHKIESEEITPKRKTIGSVSFVPSVAGLIISGEIIKDLVK